MAAPVFALALAALTLIFSYSGVPPPVPLAPLAGPPRPAPLRSRHPGVPPPVPLAPLAGPPRPAPLRSLAQPQEVVADIRVRGNVATPDAELLRLAGVEVGAPFGPSTSADVAARLQATKRFARVEVLKRFASIADPTQIALVIIVDEGPVKIELTGDPNRPTRVVRRRKPGLLWLPLLNAEDGYGLAYGVRFAIADPSGKRSRLSVPATWGGDKRVGIEFDRDVGRGLVSRLNAGASISRRTHPFFGQDEDRGRVWARAERDLIRALRVGGSTGWQHVSLLDASEGFVHAGADLTYDTRLDPTLARNALYGRAALDHYALPDRGGVNRLEIEGRGYIGLVGQTVLVVRALRNGADGPLPPYLQPVLGGLANLRGFSAGAAVGDTLVAGSAELRVPLASPLRFGKVGVSAFMDAGTVYGKGGRLGERGIRKGAGGGVWFSAAFVQLGVAVAHGVGGSTHVHAGGGVSF